MNHFDIRHLLLAGLALFSIALASLWSWNTLAELVGAPQAQFRHVVAALILLATLRIGVRRRHTTVRRHPRP